MCKDGARVAHARRDDITDLRKIMKRTGDAWALLVIQVAVGQEVEAGGERDNFKTLLFSVEYVCGGVVGNKQIKGIVLSRGLRGDIRERLGNGSVFEGIKTEEPARATGRISHGSRVTIQQRRDHAIFVNAKPRSTREKILSAVYPGGVPQAQRRSRGTIQGFIAIGSGDDGVA